MHAWPLLQGCQEASCHSQLSSAQSVTYHSSQHVDIAPENLCLGGCVLSRLTVLGSRQCFVASCRDAPCHDHAGTAQHSAADGRCQSADDSSQQTVGPIDCQQNQAPHLALCVQLTCKAHHRDCCRKAMPPTALWHGQPANLIDASNMYNMLSNSASTNTLYASHILHWLVS